MSLLARLRSKTRPPVDRRRPPRRPALEQLESRVVPYRTFSSNTTIIINDFGEAFPYPDAITSSGFTGGAVINWVGAQLWSFDHTWPDDVDVYLWSPNIGRRVMLMSDCGGDIDAVDFLLSFSDNAVGYVPDFTAITSGTYRPTNYPGGDGEDTNYATFAAAFNGFGANATWELYVWDDTAQEGGEISLGWDIFISQRPTLLSPGTYNIAEGNSVTLNANASDTDGDTLSNFQWDLNNDGAYGDATGASVLMSWATLQSFNITDNGSYTIRYQCTDGFSTETSPAGAIVVSNTNPTATFSSNSPVNEGGNATVTFTSPFDPSSIDTAAGLRYAYDLDNDGTYESGGSSYASATTSMSYSWSPDDSGSRVVRGRIWDKDGGFTDYTLAFNVDNVAPTAMFGNSGGVQEGDTATVTFTGPLDPSSVDTVAGFRYSYDFDNDGAFDVGGDSYATATTDSTAPVPALDNPSRVVRGRVWDKDGGFNDYTTSIAITNVDPTGTLGNSGAVNEGQSSTVSFSNQLDPGVTDVAAGLRYSYDFDSDGTFDVGGTSYTTASTSASVTVLALDNPMRIVRARIWDKDGGFNDYTTTLIIANVAPTGTIDASGSTTEGLDVTASFFDQFDPSTIDTAAGLHYAFDLDNDGAWDLGGDTYASSSPTFSISWPTTDNGSRIVRGRIFDKDDEFSEYVVTITVANVDPTATFDNTGEVQEGQDGTVVFSSPFDPSSDDTAAGIRYSYDFDNDGTFDVGGNSYATATTVASTSVPTEDSPNRVVRGRIWDKDGGFTDYTTTVIVTNVNPTATFTDNGSTPEGQNATVTFSGQFDPSAADTAAGFHYSYDFDNDGTFDVGGNSYGTASTSATTPVLALDNPNRVVRGRIWDKNGGFTDYVTTITVTNVDPIAVFSNDGPVLEASSVDVYFTNPVDPSPIDTAADFAYSYDFNNDGDFTDPGDLTGVAAASVSFTFDDNGAYTVRGRIHDKDGGFTEYTTIVTVTNVNPSATLANDGSVNEASAVSISFGSQFDPSTGDMLAGFTYSYDFNNDGDFTDPGDLSGVVAASAAFTFDDNGAYTVRSRIHDKDGGFAEYTTLVTVNNVPPTATLSNSGPVAETAAVTVSFTNQADASAADTLFGFTYSYDFNNDGDFTDPGEFDGVAASGHSTSFDDNGSYSIRARIHDKDGGFTDYTTVVTVTNVAPTATLTNNGPFREGLPVTVAFTSPFDVSTSDRLAGFVYSYDFNNDGDFTDPGDVLDDLSPNAHFVFINNGPFVVRAQIKDKDGGVTEYTTTVQVTNIDLIVTGFDKGGAPRVHGIDAETKQELFSFLAYDAAFKGGVRVAVGDVTGDGTPDIIVAPGSGGKLLMGTLDVKVFDGVSLQPLAGPFGGLRPFGDTFRKGFHIAAGDVNGDGFTDIIVGPAGGFNPLIKVFSGQDGIELHSILAYPIFGAYNKGVRVAAGDVNGDGLDDIITHSGNGPTSQLKVFDGGTGVAFTGAYASLNPFADLPKVKAGLFVTAADVNADGKTDIILGVMKGAPLLRVINGSTGLKLADLNPAEELGYKTGLRVAMADVNGDGVAEILTSTAKAKRLRAHVQVFDAPTLNEIDSFFADPANTFLGGVFVAGGR